MSATLAQKNDSSIFNFGSVLERLAGSAVDAVEQVAPVWLANELDLNRQIPVSQAPTFQNTDPRRQPSPNLTTTQNPQNATVISDPNLLILFGIGALVVTALFLGQD